MNSWIGKNSGYQYIATASNLPPSDHPRPARALPVRLVADGALAPGHVGPSNVAKARPVMFNELGS